MIDLPAVYLFNVDNDFVDFFDKKIKFYKEISFYVKDTLTVNGFQTDKIIALN